MRLLAIISILICSFHSFAQTREELIEEFQRERAKMMQEIMKMFQDDFSGADSFFDDFDDMDMDTLFNNRSFTGGGANVSVEQKYEDDGSMTILITPKNENVSLDIQTTDNMITIKSETRVEQTDEQGTNRTKSYSRSSFTKSIGIPTGYVAQKPVPEGKSIKIVLSPKDQMKKIVVPKSTKKEKPKPKQEKIPIGKRPGEEML